MSDFEITDVESSPEFDEIEVKSQAERNSFFIGAALIKLFLSMQNVFCGHRR